MKKSQKGLTLIELLVVIGILGVLGSVLVTIIDPVKQLKKARDGKRKAEVGLIQQALELYRSDQGEYPQGPLACDQSLKVGQVTYVEKIPCDPLDSTQPYSYTPDPAPAYKYRLVACLENTADIDRDGSNQGCPSGRWSYTRNNP